MAFYPKKLCTCILFLQFYILFAIFTCIYKVTHQLYMSIPTSGNAKYHIHFIAQCNMMCCRIRFALATLMLPHLIQSMTCTVLCLWCRLLLPIIACVATIAWGWLTASTTCSTLYTLGRELHRIIMCISLWHGYAILRGQKLDRLLHPDMNLKH